MDWEIEKNIEKARNGISKITSEILSIDGMSSACNRHLLNNLAGMREITYLEVGIHKGSTFISALYGNNIKNAYAIDNWCGFGNMENEFKNNCSQFGIKYKFLNKNCMDVDPKDIGNINFYFFDGEHWDYVTADALSHFYDSFADEFLYVVDDYRLDDVQRGVKTGIKRCDFKIEKQVILLNENENDKTWWEGLGIFMLRK